MARLLSIVFCLLLIVFSSCDSGSREADTLLDTIDSLSTTHPDSALILLGGTNVGAGPVPARWPHRATFGVKKHAYIAPPGASGWHRGLPLHVRPALL